jgi:hypothetical protein
MLQQRTTTDSTFYVVALISLHIALCVEQYFFFLPFILAMSDLTFQQCYRGLRQ